MEVKSLNISTRTEFRQWLEKNHDKKEKVQLVLYKRHTGKPAPTHRELLEEAICFGWIDTTIKKLDEDRYARFFVRRNANSKWSENTLRYAQQMIAEDKMTPIGLKFYQEGAKKPTHDHGIPKNPTMPCELKQALAQDKSAQTAFAEFPPSKKKMLYRWILSGKRPETRTKRVEKICKAAREGQKQII